MVTRDKKLSSYCVQAFPNPQPTCNDIHIINLNVIC